jgi:outer membrane murein-binding lipoprotein Lpp
MRRSILPAQWLRLTLVLGCASLLIMPRAHAVSKEIVELQTQVQQLQDAIAQMKQSNDERLGAIINLVQQNTDSVNKMTANVGQLQQALATQNENGGGKIDQISGQLQALNDSVDELKTRIGRLDTAMANIQAQLQNTPANVPTGGSAPPAQNPGMAANQQPGNGGAPGAMPRPTRARSAITTPASMPWPARSSATSSTTIPRMTWPETRSSTWARSRTARASIPKQ